MYEVKAILFRVSGSIHQDGQQTPKDNGAPINQSRLSVLHFYRYVGPIAVNTSKFDLLSRLVMHRGCDANMVTEVGYRPKFQLICFLSVYIYIYTPMHVHMCICVHTWAYILIKKIGLTREGISWKSEKVGKLTPLTWCPLTNRSPKINRPRYQVKGNIISSVNGMLFSVAVYEPFWNRTPSPQNRSDIIFSLSLGSIFLNKRKNGFNLKELSQEQKSVLIAHGRNSSASIFFR